LRVAAIAGGRQKKRAASLSPAALVVNVSDYSLHAHLKAADASKKAKAKKGKEVKAALMSIH
jgi:hypothetical protein